MVHFLTTAEWGRYSSDAPRWTTTGRRRMVKRGAPTDEQLEQLATLFRLLSDRTRLNLLMMLADGERNVTNLCETLRLPQPTVSHHLGLLRMNNIIANRRDGKQIFYSLNGRVDEASKMALQIGTENFRVGVFDKDA